MAHLRITPLFLLFFILFMGQWSHACPNLTVGFSTQAANSCVPRNVTFSNSSTGTHASTAFYSLYVNGVLVDTATGNAQDLTHIFAGTGAFSIKLFALDTSGCLDSSTANYTVTRVKPRIRDQNNLWTSTPQWINCIQFSSDPDTFKITTTNEDSLGQIVSVWGDGNIDTLTGGILANTTLTHTYMSSGVFNPFWITEDSSGCVDTLFGRVINERVPTAGIIGPNSGSNIGCAPFTVAFTNNSANISTGTSFSWEFGDGSTEDFGYVNFNQKVTHTYTSALCQGTVKLTASNTCGQSFTTWNPLNISQTDMALFSIDSTNCDRTGNFSFTNLSIDSFCLLPDPKFYKWDFGDGDTSAWLAVKGSISHNYKTEGPKRVCLIANNKCGNDTFCQSFEAMYRPQVGFILDTTWGCGTLTVTVTDTSTAYQSARLWNFGDGTTSRDSVVTHTYSSVGMFTITLSHSNRCGTESESKSVEIFELPNAALSSSPDGCAPHTIQPRNLSSTDFPASAQYRWLYMNTDTLVYEPGSVLLADSGWYAVLLELTDSCGMDSAMYTIRVDLIPTLVVDGDSVKCATDSVNFTNQSSNYAFIEVDFGDGSKDTLLSNGSFSHLYAMDGTYEVTFSAVNGGICLDKDTLEVLVKSNSQASFSANRIGACTPFGFVFTNTSQDANTFRWYMNDSLVSTDFEPDIVYVFTDTTLIDVRLWAIDSNSCYADSSFLQVFTSKMPEAHFSVVSDSGCGPWQDTFANQSLFASTYLWDFGTGITSTDSQPNARFLPSDYQDTTYIVQLIARNWLGCADTTYGQRKIFPKPNVAFQMSDTNGCGPLTTSFGNLSNPKDTSQINEMEFYWNIGQGSWDTLQTALPETYVASKTQDSIYTIQLIGVTDHMCKDTHSINLTVFPDPTVEFGVSDSAGCGPLVVHFTNQSVPNNFGNINDMQFLWDFGNGVSSTQAHDSAHFSSSLLRDTFYTIKLVGFSEHGCSDSLDTILQVYPKPFADFSLDTNAGCGPLRVSFTNRSHPLDTGSISDMTFLWSFEESIASAARDTDYVFVGENLADSLYPIELVAISEHGCLDTAERSVLVHPRPTSEFTSSLDSGCGPLEVDFQSNAQLNDTNFWDLGDGFTLSKPDTSKTFPFLYLSDSSTIIRYFTRTQYGCTSDTSASLVKVFAQPIVDFDVNDDSICFKELMTTLNTSQGVDTNLWNIDGEQHYNVLNVESRYSPNTNPVLGRTVPIHLTGRTTNGCEDSRQDSFYIFPYPISRIQDIPDSFCSPVRINFTNQSVNYARSVWDLDSMDTAFTVDASKRYENVSNIDRFFNVRLMVESRDFCKDTSSIRFKLTPQPISSFSPFRRDVCDSGYYKLLNTSINNRVNSWSATNGWQSAMEDPETLFLRNNQGKAYYTVELIAENGSGCKDTSSHQLELNPFQTVDFNGAKLPIVCTEDVIQFQNQSVHSVFQKWTFGDGAESRDSQPNYFYKNDGIFNVKLVGYDVNGCADSVESIAMIEVAPRPVARFNYAPQFPKLPSARVIFSNNSSPTTGLSHAWEFGDGNTSTLEHPEHVYQDSGWKNVQLIVRSALCPDTAWGRVYVEPPFPQIDIQASDTAGCGPLSVLFVPISEDASSYRWFFDDGNESRLDSPTHVFTEPGYYHITAIAYGPGGASDTTIQNMIRVYPKPRAAFYPKPEEAYLPDAFFDFTNETVGGNRYAWYVFASQNQSLIGTDTEEHLNITLNEVGEYDVLLIAENDFGCLDSVMSPRVIRVLDGGELYIPSAFTPNGKNGNDYFLPFMQGVDPDGYQLVVYNRWGEKLFETKDMNQGWDGMYLNRMSPNGQYIYTIKGSFISGKQFDEKGTVFLLR